MSDWDSRYGPPRRRNPAVAVLMVLLGLPLLLPGVCSLLFTYQGQGNPIAGIGLLISLVGIALLCFGVGRLFNPHGPVSGSEGVKLFVLLVLFVVVLFFGLWLFATVSNVKLRN